MAYSIKDVPWWAWIIVIVLIVVAGYVILWGIAKLGWVPYSWRCQWPLYYWSITDRKEKYDFTRDCYPDKTIGIDTAGTDSSEKCVSGDVNNYKRVMCDFGNGCGTFTRKPSQQLTQVKCDPADKNWKELNWVNLTPSPESGRKCEYSQCYAPPEAATRIGEPVIGYFWKASVDAKTGGGGTSEFANRLRETCSQTPGCVAVTSQQVNPSTPLDPAEIQKFIPEGDYPVTHIYAKGEMLSTVPEVDKLIEANGASSFYMKLSGINDIGTWKWGYGRRAY